MDEYINSLQKWIEEQRNVKPESFKWELGSIAIIPNNPDEMPVPLNFWEWKHIGNGVIVNVQSFKGKTRNEVV